MVRREADLDCGVSTNSPGAPRHGLVAGEMGSSLDGWVAIWRSWFCECWVESWYLLVRLGLVLVR